MRRRGAWAIGGLAALAAGTACWVWATWPQTPPAPGWSGEYDTATDPSKAGGPGDAIGLGYDLTARMPEELPAGTVVGRTAPAGWSHLVIKSLPRVRDDQKAGLPALTIEKAAWMFTAFLADVRADQHEGKPRYRFRAIGLGLGATMNGRDTILTPEMGKMDGIDLGWIGRTILSKGYEVQRQALVVVRGPVFGLMDTPVWFRCGADNRLLRYRYALLVDEPTGRLDVLLWRVGGEAAACGGLEQAVWLKPDTIDVAELVVDRRKMSPIGLPGDDAFAVAKMPAGRAVFPLPPDLRPLAAQTRFTTDEARALEARLRKVIAEAPPSP